MSNTFLNCCNIVHFTAKQRRDSCNKQLLSYDKQLYTQTVIKSGLKDCHIQGHFIVKIITIHDVYTE